MTLTEITDRQFAKVWVKLGGEEELSALWSSWWRREPDITISPVLEENVAWLEDLATLPDGILGCPKGVYFFETSISCAKTFLNKGLTSFYIRVWWLLASLESVSYHDRDYNACDGPLFVQARRSFFGSYYAIVYTRRY